MTERSFVELWLREDPVDGVEPVPLLVDLPHSGTWIPREIAERMTDAGRLVADTDWHLGDIYRRIVPQMGGTLLMATHSRYVVDLNRPSGGEALYPGRDETSVVPTSSFAGQKLYEQGLEPGAEEVAARVERYWKPYHARLRAELDTLRDRFGSALLWDGHSVRGWVPRFSAEPLPDLMLGDVGGDACIAERSDRVLETLQRGWSEGAVVRNHVFRGGYITRAYGRPDEGVDALQMEMSQRIYMNEDPPFDFDEERAARLATALSTALRAFLGR